MPPSVWSAGRRPVDRLRKPIASQVLERIAPGRVVVDPHGRAIQFNIPADAEGPRMLETVPDQIQRAMNCVREAVGALLGKGARRSLVPQLADHPQSLYVRGDSILPHLDSWIASLVSPEALAARQDDPTQGGRAAPNGPVCRHICGGRNPPSG